MTNKLALLIAVVLGVLSIVGIRLYVERLEAKSKRDLNPIPVMVANRDIAPGETFSRSDLDQRLLPAQFVDQAFQGSHIQDDNTVLGLRTVHPIAAGQVLQTYHFNMARQGHVLQDAFTSDYRAYTIPISPVQAVAGLLKPGDYVDVSATMPFVGEGGEGTTVTFSPERLKGIPILATGAITDRFDPRAGNGSYGSLTFRLRPEDVNLLKHLVDSGAAISVSFAQPKTAPDAKHHPVSPDVIYKALEAELKQAIRRR